MKSEFMPRYPRALVLLMALCVCVVLGSSASAQQEPRSGLEPGKKANLGEKVPVNYVFVGYEPGDVGKARFLNGLPEKYKPVVRSKLSYGASREEATLGIEYTYGHKVFFAGDDYEDRFFGYLKKISRRAEKTLYQRQYNQQKNNVLKVPNNHFIDAPSVERHLLNKPPEGVNTSRNTIYFINWWGNEAKPRKGFEYHVYTKTNEPDPDTDYNFGAKRESRKIIAWGGTASEDEESNTGGKDSRVWFYDLSAGPEAWSNNWNVDDADVDGDGSKDARFPPIWEYYAKDGYRPASALSGDLSRVARYVGINLLFTSSPLYPPQFTPRLLPNRVDLDLNTVEGLSGVNSSARYQTPRLVLDEVDEVHRVPYSLDEQDRAYKDKAKECYVGWVVEQYTGSGSKCYSRYRNYPKDANLFLYGALNRKPLTDDDDYREYEAVLLNWAVKDGKNGRTSPPALGFADDNYRDGTQSFVFSFVSPAITEAGYGLSTTEIHEYGHHLNFSHPHDGYDYERDLDYGPEGRFQYAWSGDETNSIMSYIDLNWDFSQFDQDNTNRFQAAAYINNANALAARILASPDAGQAATDLASAGKHYGRAKDAMRNHKYVSTFNEARLAYEDALKGARKAGVEPRASEDGRTAYPADQRSRQSLQQEIPPGYIDKGRINFDPGARITPEDHADPISKRFLP